VKTYLPLLRLKHWPKNVFIFPGVLLALRFSQLQVNESRLAQLAVLTLSVCLASSANYLINEWYDRDFDRLHPQKNDRLLVSRELKPTTIARLYAALLAMSLALASLVNLEVVMTVIVFIAMGVIYNVKPLRTKERLLVDVLSESINHPIRFLAGWFAITPHSTPPGTVLIAYWMAGAFAMALKRYAELQSFSDRTRAAGYRKSFRFYTPKGLLAFSIGCFGISFATLALFLQRLGQQTGEWKVVLILPIYLALSIWYFVIALKPKSSVGAPETIYRERAFFAALLAGAGICSLLLFK
jgi:decaprenyl-phosphate phosphoribosyltransferase